MKSLAQLPTYVVNGHGVMVGDGDVVDCQFHNSWYLRFGSGESVDGFPDYTVGSASDAFRGYRLAGSCPNRVAVRCISTVEMHPELSASSGASRDDVPVAQFPTALGRYGLCLWSGECGAGDKQSGGDCCREVLEVL